MRRSEGLFTSASWDVGGCRRESGGCVATRARVPGRFAIATEAVVCRRWPVRALVPHRARASRALEPRFVTPCSPGPRPSACSVQRAPWSRQPVCRARAVHVSFPVAQWPRSRAPAIVARCKEAATVNPCVSGCVACVSSPHGVCRSPVTIFRKLTASGIRNKNEWITKLPAPGNSHCILTSTQWG